MKTVKGQLTDAQMKENRRRFTEEREGRIIQFFFEEDPDHSFEAVYIADAIGLSLENDDVFDMFWCLLEGLEKKGSLCSDDDLCWKLNTENFSNFNQKIHHRGKNIMKNINKKSQHTQAAYIAQKTGLKYEDAGLICQIAEGIQKNKNNQDEKEEGEKL